jgi:hypothetical protein
MRQAWDSLNLLKQIEIPSVIPAQAGFSAYSAVERDIRWSKMLIAGRIDFCGKVEAPA